ncbi:Pre-mRNA-splicing factor 38 [Elsinoe fawcettii]|nr:Pre-mRNA-splicing factor 38 [Elsinoe fawcettii]
MAHSADASRMLDNRGYTGPLIRGQNPLTLVDAPIRDRITESYYWKEQCFGLNSATLLDRAVELTHVGGTYGVAQKPTPFLCLLFKMLQLTPEKEIVDLYLGRGGEEWKYLRALGAMYVRLTGEAKDVYEMLEGYLGDRRKLKRRTREGYRLSFVDEFVDELLTKERVCGVSLWKMPARTVLEDLDQLEPRVSLLGSEVEDLDDDDDEDGVLELRNGNGHHTSDDDVRNGRGSSDASE